MEGQHPLLKVVEGIGEPEQTQDEWEGRFMLGVAVLVKQLHAANPPQQLSRVGADLLEWADRLEAHGRSRLESLGLPVLQAV